MKNLIQRLITSLVGVPVILIVSYLDEVVFFFFISILTVLGIIEYFELIKNHKKKPNFNVVLLGSLLIAAGAFIHPVAFMMLFTLVVVFTVASNLSSDNVSNFSQVAGSSVFPVMYFGWFLGHGILIRNIGFDENAVRLLDGLRDPGFFFLVIVYGCTFVNDTGAFFIGKKFGRNKLSSTISPGKTVEGTVGGVLLSVVSALLINGFFSDPLSWQWCVIYGLLIGITAMFGDLVESALKRGAAVKDSGGIVPGHGGILDRFDSFFFVFPAAYYLTLLFLYLG